MGACWLGILAALCALPVVYFDRSWLLQAAQVSATQAQQSHLFAHFALGVAGILLLLATRLVFLRHLQRFVRAVHVGHPFAHGHALRLRRMAWLMLGMEGLSILIGLHASWMGPGFAWLEVGGGMSITGLIAVLMLFVMARVFAVGAAMRDDLDGLV
ncbi:DUF2975 domain-containing protein [Stenotrophomonas sp.]|uniref:DUF2975 domain-containing protein n=1 Tax=Stenotrophomonas sp. TaxID=69392 RepID=UPI002FCA282A